MEQKDTYEKYISTKEIRFKAAKGMRDIRGREIHNYHEIFLFVGGEAEFICETGRYYLSPGTVVIIPAGSFHQFVVYGDESEYCRLVLNFYDISRLDSIINRKLDRVYLIKDSEAEYIFSRFQRLCGKPLPEPENGILMDALLAQLVITLKKESEFKPIESGLSGIVQQALAYIDSNLPGAIHVNEIADALYVSVSYLSHCFRDELHISVYRYVLEKRLSVAGQMILNGTQPTAAASVCGFNDYSSFYRQYKKAYGVSPNESRRHEERAMRNDTA